MDFARYPEWHTTFIQFITPMSSQKNPFKLLQGETLSTKINGVNLVPVVEANTSQEFAWYGSAYGGAFSGKHYSQFFESHVTPGGTTFVHGEDYDGWMTWMFRKGVCGIGRRNIVKLFKGFVRDVKRRSEDMKKLKEGIQKTQEDPWAKI